VEKVNGYVAFLDVLGFRDLLARDDNLTEVQKYIDGIRWAVEENGAKSLQLALFSDSIIVNTTEDDEPSFLQLIEACSRIFGFLLTSHVPLRGAISYGPFIRSRNAGADSAIVAGRPIVEAFEREQKQDWVGITLAPSVVRHLPMLAEKTTLFNKCESYDQIKAIRARLPWVMHLRNYQSVPLHTQRLDEPDSMVGYAIIPVQGGIRSPIEWLKRADELRRAIVRMLELAPDGASQRKCRRLQEFVNDAFGHLAFGVWMSPWCQDHAVSFDWQGSD
jgi:hypothetical protein